ncbi:MAG: MinD/ParA family protein [Burkholderiales bacterium]|nr:MinD/ParA family protein [Anaerolineae bacterium]
MGNIVSVHSFRGGTGKSNTVANVAALLSTEGYRVGVVDTDIQSPGIHVLFGLRGDSLGATLNDYLWRGAAINTVAQDVTPAQISGDGKLFLIPSSTKPGEISRVLREGYDAQKLTTGFTGLVKALDLDYLIIDTHPGLNEETLLSMVMSNTLVIVMRPDQQDYEGTYITVQVAQQLGVPNLMLVVNKTPRILKPDEVKSEVETTYGIEVAAVLPHSEEMMNLASRGIFAQHYPDHPMTEHYRRIARKLSGT